MLYIGLYREKNEKIFVSETIKPRAMIFGTSGFLPSLFKLYPWGQNGPTPGVTCFT